MARRYFALIIGIDEYKSPTIASLNGCVSDARSIQECLTRVFGPAPESAVMVLTNANATRAAILSAFRTHLIDNPQIEQGEPIIIYFAGHSGRVPAGDFPSGYVDTICPSDESVLAEDELLIPGIPKFTINALLQILAREKGNNITFVYDSCQFGGAVGKEPQTARYHPGGAVPMPAHIDREILLTAKGEDLQFGFHGSRSSHVLLAAFAEDDTAYEGIDTGTHTGCIRGTFTNALTRQLNRLEYQIRVGCVTYSNLIKSLELPPSQHPQCEGELASGILFAGRNRIAPCVFDLIWREGTLYVAAGAAHGIVEGTEMLVYKEASALTSLGVLVARDVHAFTATLGRKDPTDFFPVPDTQGRARVLRWNTGDLKIFSDPSLSLQLPMPYSEYRVCLVNVKSAGHIALHAPDRNGIIRIERQDHLIPTYAIRNIMIPPDLTDCLPFILNGIAHFHYHLGRQMPSATRLLQAPLISPHVALEMYRLDRRHRNGATKPDKNNLFKKNIARLSIDNVSWKYGIKIVNKSDYGLYPYLFYFDPSDYCINLLYQPPFTATTPPLEPGGFVTIGYGGAGGEPLQFQAPGGASDACFLKLIVSTQNINLDHTSQSPLFETPSEPSRVRPAHANTMLATALFAQRINCMFWDVSLGVVTFMPSTRFSCPSLLESLRTKPFTPLRLLKDWVAPSTALTSNLRALHIPAF
ncbi:caspase domain-containing protein [Mycena sp. CBHHK59/15]|nr:caspase domain-containing protein [Mycena sp. CBHHK59/15]